jgi:uncharacterized membrane protein YedE/YeeE
LNNALEAFKQILAFAAGLPPLLAMRFSLLPFLNPQIAEDQWSITAILSAVASLIFFNFARRPNQRSAAGYFALVGLLLSILSLCTMFAIVDGLILSGQTTSQDFLARLCFLFLFVGIGLGIGYVLASLSGSEVKN